MVLSAVVVDNSPTHMIGTFKGPVRTNRPILRWPMLNYGDLLRCRQENSPYEGGTYEVDIDIPQSYPFAAPKMRFITYAYFCYTYGYQVLMRYSAGSCIIQTSPLKP